MPRLVTCLLCDDVRYELGGKQTLVGLFDQFNVVDFSQPLPSFKIFVRLAVDDEGEFPIAIRLLSREGDFRIELPGQFSAQDRSEVSGLYEGVVALAINGMRVPRPGHYDVRIVVGG